MGHFAKASKTHRDRLEGVVELPREPRGRRVRQHGADYPGGGAATPNALDDALEVAADRLDWKTKMHFENMSNRESGRVARFTYT